jgi:ApaG protein
MLRAVAERRTPGSEQVTEGIRVRVDVVFSPDLSQLDPDAVVSYVHTYTVTVTNDARQAATLVARHWIITDGTGRDEHIRGPGVVGLQPSLGQGQSFTYSSSVVIGTTTGMMEGEYLMEWEDGVRFGAKIAPFALVVPGAVH